jgi:hypothetical protein
LAVYRQSDTCIVFLDASVAATKKKKKMKMGAAGDKKFAVRKKVGGI